MKKRMKKERMKRGLGSKTGSQTGPRSHAMPLSKFGHKTRSKKSDGE